MNHRSRKFGHSKYGVRRIVKGFLDLMTVSFLTGYGQRPQHLLGSLGLLSFSVGGLGILWLTFWWFFSRVAPFIEPINLHERAVFYYTIVALLLGAQFLCIGFLAEMLTAFNMRDTLPYSVQARTDDDKPDAGV